jgi:O-antigen/teichoic acid export membrane protein
MSDISKRVLNNSLLRAAGYAIGAAIFFVTIVLIARYLGTEGFGHFSLIIALVGIFQLVTDMGVRNILIRDIALDQANFRKHLGVARTLLWMLSLISMGFIVVLANLLHLTADVRQAMYIAGLAAIVTFYSLGYSAVLRAFEEMEWDILGFVLHKAIFIALIWLTMQTRFGLKGVFVAMLLANASQWCYFWVLVGIRHGRTKLNLDLTASWALLSESFPLGMAEILGRLTQHMGKILLAALGTPVALGLFSAAYKFLEAINPFTTNLTLPLFPVFSRLAQVSSLKLFRAYEQSLKFLYATGMPLAVILFVFSDRIVLLFFGEAYREAEMALRLLAPAVVLLLPTSIYGYVFTALGCQRLYMRCMAASLVVNTLLDLLLIPFYSYLGAAIGTLAGQAALFLAGLMMLQRLGSDLSGLWLLWRPLLAGIAMGLCCWLPQDMGLASAIFGVFSGLIAYTGLLLILQTFTQQERSLLLNAMRIRLGNVGQ